MLLTAVITEAEEGGFIAFNLVELLNPETGTWGGKVVTCWASTCMGFSRTPPCSGPSSAPGPSL